MAPPQTCRLLSGIVSCLLGLTILTVSSQAGEAVWQWSVPVGEGRTFLWIPEDCVRVRAVVVGQHNMSEEGILEHPVMRSELAKLGIAEVWIAPPIDGPFDFTQGAGERLEAVLTALARASGYAELADAPIVALGHSACATFPWNLAAWKPGRTLAVISYKGDAPQTNLTGYGRANISWGDRTINGVPGLMVMAEYEWWEDRLTPALAYRAAHPGSPIALLAEPGRGHFDTSAEMVAFLALFIRKSAEHRLTGEGRPLQPVDPAQGWLVQRWRLNQPRTVPPAPVASYTGDPADACWAFDEEMARALHSFRANQVGRQPQLLGFVQEEIILPQTNTHNQVTLRFRPEVDGLTFHLTAAFLETVDSGSTNPMRWTGLPPGAPISHATGGGSITLSRITGPVVQVANDTFRVLPNRTWSTTDRRNHDIWLLASHPGDATHKSAVQQALLKLSPNTIGTEQRITFPGIPDQGPDTKELKLAATSDAGVPVGYYVREGPAVVDGDTLRLTAIPPRARRPLAVTVVAWQLGRGAEPRLRAAEPVTRTFFLTP